MKANKQSYTLRQHLLRIEAQVESPTVAIQKFALSLSKSKIAVYARSGSLSGYVEGRLRPGKDSLLVFPGQDPNTTILIWEESNTNNIRDG